tara:strand:+ start:258 stop:452 length:195 start_codon:yes stop_codon:yes gene_type:complete
MGYPFFVSGSENTLWAAFSDLSFRIAGDSPIDFFWAQPADKSPKAMRGFEKMSQLQSEGHFHVG